MAEVRQLVDEVGTGKGRSLTFAARVFATEAENPAQRARRQDLAGRGQPGPRRRGSLRFPVRDEPAACPVARRRRQRQRRGANTLEVETRRLEPSAGYERTVNGIEIQVRYNEFIWPEGLDVERVEPIAP